MSLQANLVLADGQSTPVNHTFSPRGADLALATWRDISQGIAIGMPTVTISNRDDTAKGGSYRVEARVTVPVLETISGDAGGYTPSPKVAYKMFGKCELVSPARATLANRKDLVAFVKNLMANAVISETFQDFNPAN